MDYEKLLGQNLQALDKLTKALKQAEMDNTIAEEEEAEIARDFITENCHLCFLTDFDGKVELHLLDCSDREPLPMKWSDIIPSYIDCINSVVDGEIDETDRIAALKLLKTVLAKDIMLLDDEINKATT